MRDNDSRIRDLIDYQMLVKDQEKRIVRLATALYIGNEEEQERLINTFAIENEEIYLKLKRLIYDIQGKEIGNIHERIGTTDSFPSSLEKSEEGVWKFHLPPFYSVQSSDRGVSNAGKHIFYLMLNLEIGYEEENGRIEKIEKPLVVFEHHICSDVQRVFDFDNIDSKRALDAMQCFFLDDDNALSLVTMNVATADPSESYCDIYIADRSNPEIYKKLAKTVMKQ